MSASNTGTMGSTLINVSQSSLTVEPGGVSLSKPAQSLVTRALGLPSGTSR